MALAVMLTALFSLASLASAGPPVSGRSQSYASRTETVPDGPAEAAQGRGRLKVINDSGRAIAFRLVGPTAGDTQTALIAPWTEHVFGELAGGRWMARYCLGEHWQPEVERFASTGECDEVTDPLVFMDGIDNGRLRYFVSVMRFGPSPREWPSTVRITPDDFAGD
jgi:hypothetical protein